MAFAKKRGDTTWTAYWYERDRSGVQHKRSKGSFRTKRQAAIYGQEQPLRPILACAEPNCWAFSGATWTWSGGC